MTKPRTPSLLAEPLMVVAPTAHIASKYAVVELGLRPREWRVVTELAHVEGLRHGRYHVVTWAGEWTDGALSVMDVLRDPSRSFVHLPVARVKNLSLRDRAEEQMQLSGTV